MNAHENLPPTAACYHTLRSRPGNGPYWRCIGSNDFDSDSSVSSEMPFDWSRISVDNASARLEMDCAYALMVATPLRIEQVSRTTSRLHEVFEVQRVEDCSLPNAVPSLAPRQSIR